MCMIDDCDEFFTVTCTKQVRARKPHRCGECQAAIAPGDTYRRTTGLMPSYGWETYRICGACTEGPVAWLQQECGGFVFHGVYDDLAEHWSEGYWAWEPSKDPVKRLQLGRLVVEMRRRATASVR